MAALVERMRALAVPLVIHANFVDPTACERVAGRTGAAVLSLPASVGGEEGLDEYADLFETIVTRLAANLDPLEGAGP